MQYNLYRYSKRSLYSQVTTSGELVAGASLFMLKYLIDRFIEQNSTCVSKRLIELQKPISPKTEYFSEEELKTYIQSEVSRYSQIMKLHPSGIRYTHVHSYWGTCAASGMISFNMALRYTTKDAVSYVVVHELTHLRRRGHGPRFWAMVEKYYPRTKEMRKLLRKIPRSL